MSEQNITNIYDFVTDEIENYESPKGITLEDGYDWSMKQHLRRSFLYLNSQFWKTTIKEKIGHSEILYCR